MSITLQDMVNFVGDRSTPEKEEEIRKQFEDPDSFATKFIKEWCETARTAYDVDWSKLAFGPFLSAESSSSVTTDGGMTTSMKQTDAGKPVASSFDQRLMETSNAATKESTPHSYIEPYREEIVNYLALDRDELLSDLFAFTAGIRSSDPLSPYYKRLRQVICQEWDWPSKRLNPKYADMILLTLDICELLSPLGNEFPFPVTLIAATLVKGGLDNLCGCLPVPSG